MVARSHILETLGKQRYSLSNIPLPTPCRLYLKIWYSLHCRVQCIFQYNLDYRDMYNVQDAGRGAILWDQAISTNHRLGAVHCTVHCTLQCSIQCWVQTHLLGCNQTAWEDLIFIHISKTVLLKHITINPYTIIVHLSLVWQICFLLPKLFFSVRMARIYLIDNSGLMEKVIFDQIHS